MTITARMQTYLRERIYIDPSEIAGDVANGAFEVPRGVYLDEVAELAAHLACWVAGEADAHVNIDDEDDWPLIATMAELAALTMLAQRRACIEYRGYQIIRRPMGYLIHKVAFNDYEHDLQHAKARIDEAIEWTTAQLLTPKAR